MKILIQPYAVDGTNFLLSRRKKRLVEDWRERFIKRHGNTAPKDIFSQGNIDGNFELFFLAYPRPAYVL
jgi:hypothetical protein